MGKSLPVSVIVPVYNAGGFLKKCIDSILAQTFRDFELILIDDGSTDDSSSLCDEYALSDARIKVIHQLNAGQSAARNRAIELASGDYLAFIDADDYVSADYLEYLFELLRLHPECLFSACNHAVVRGNHSRPNFEADAPLLLDRKQAYESVLYHGAVDVAPWGKLFHRSVFNTLRFPAGRLYEDTYIFGDILNIADCVVVGNEAKYFYVQHGNSTVNGGFNPKRLEFIEAVEKLASQAESCDPSLHDGAVRRVTHSYLSVLRYMDSCSPEYMPLRNELRKRALENTALIMHDEKSPRRDKFALLALQAGFAPFFSLWKIYNLFR